ANVFEGGPTIGIAALLKPIAVAHPTKQIANRIADGQSIEVVSLQPAPAQAGEWLHRKQCQRPQHGVTVTIVPRDIEPDAIVRRREGVHGPISTVALVPNRAAIQKFNKGL